MSDIADRAGELEEQQRVHALRAQATNVVELPKHDRDGKRVCLACEERLSQKRLKAAPRAVRCVECQDLHEKRQRGYR
jgi:phage/conjugal plasmid C-4 type zinc finger TraR family protein